MDCSLRRVGLRFIAGHLSLLFLFAFAWLPGFSSAAETAATAPGAGKRFATVWRVRGEITVSGVGRDRLLRDGDTVLVGERVRAPALAEAVLKTEDGGFVAVRPGTEFVAERFAAEGKPTDNFTVRLLAGSLRIITGWIGSLNRAEHQVLTPSATIGIRGTDHEPYVLSAELAAATSSREGTYDKVNRGGTTLDVGEQKLDIDAGRVGFVRAAPKPAKMRALMTILLPVLLEKVPDFYVPGEFDVELDRLSQTVDDDSQQQLTQRRQRADDDSQPSPAAPQIPPAAPVVTPPVAPPATPERKAVEMVMPAGKCVPAAVAKAWLGQLDGAIVNRDAPAILALFAADVLIQSTVRGRSGEMTTIDLGREEFAQSAVAAMKGLTDFKQRRVSVEGKKLDSGKLCKRISVKSVVIEQGSQAGKPFRFESLEGYTLELRDGKWLSIKADSIQR